MASKPVKRIILAAARLVIPISLSLAVFYNPAVAATAPGQPQPEALVAQVYGRLIADEHNSPQRYTPPETIYTPRLKALVAAARRSAQGEEPCGLDFEFWVDGQDYSLKDLTVTRGASSTPGRATVIATFHNLGTAEKIVFDFQDVSGRWLLDDAHSVGSANKWTFSKLLQCQ